MTGPIRMARVCGGRLFCSIGHASNVARAFGRRRYFTGEVCVNGHVSWRYTIGDGCIECHRERSAQQARERSPERKRAQTERKEPHKIRYRTDPEYRQRMRDNALARGRRLSPDEKREQRRRWRRNNPEKFRQLQKTKRARRRGAVGSFTRQDIERIFKAQRGRCAYYRSCRTKLGDDYHADHILPLAGGGTNNADNIQLTCPACNLSKNAKHP